MHSKSSACPWAVPSYFHVSMLAGKIVCKSLVSKFESWYAWYVQYGSFQSATIWRQKIQRKTFENWMNAECNIYIYIYISTGSPWVYFQCMFFHFWKITANHLDAFIIPGIFYFEKWAQKCLVYFAKLHFILKKNTHAWDDDISTLNLNEIWDSAFSHIACAAASVRSGHPFQNKTPTSCFQFNLKDGIIFIPMNAFNVLTEAYSP